MSLNTFSDFTCTFICLVFRTECSIPFGCHLVTQSFPSPPVFKNISAFYL